MAVKGRRKATNQRRVLIINTEQAFALGMSMAMEKSAQDTARWASCLRSRQPGEGLKDIGTLGFL